MTTSNSTSPTKVAPTARKTVTPPAAAPIESLEPHELLRRLMRTDNDMARLAGRFDWGLPATGEYAGGCMAGKAAARGYLKVLRGGSVHRGTLQCIALDMLGRSNLSESVRGQAVGFFSEIDNVLIRCARLLTSLDQESFDSLIDQMERGLARTKADDEAELSAARSRVAREVWQRRKAAKAA